MNLYLISQNVNNDYDTYDSAVVVAENEGEARMIHPAGKDYKYDQDEKKWIQDFDGYISNDWSWCNNLKKISVKCIGIASKEMVNGEVVCASFNAG